MPVDHKTQSALLDALDRAEQRASTCVVNLQDANRCGGAVLAITTLRLIEDAARLRNQIAELRRAITADASEEAPASRTR